MLPQYYKIVIKDNNIATVYKIDFNEYNEHYYNFEYVYYTKNGNTYQLHKNFDADIDMLIVDDDNLYNLLDDLIDQCFCDTIEYSFIEDYFRR